MWFGAVCLAHVVASAAAMAQSTAVDVRPRLTVALSVDQMAQLVPETSPLRFSGLGLGARIGVDQSSDGSYSAAALDITLGALRSSAATGHLPRDQVGFGALSAERLRGVGSSVGAGVKVYLGVRADAIVEVDQLSHAAPYQSLTDLNGFAQLTADLAGRVELPLAHGVLSSDLAIPVAGFADVPYADAKSEQTLHLRPVAVNSLLAVDDRISYHTTFTGGIGVVWTYHLAWMQYARDGTRRYARQGAEAALSLPLGRTRP